MFDYKKYVDGLLGVADRLINLPHSDRAHAAASASQIRAHATASAPDRADKCSAVGRIYYALFSELCGSNAEAFIGSGLRKAWGEVYRGLNHGEARKACNHLKNMKKFPQELREFAHLFEQLQGRRHLADYDPTVDFDESDIQNWLHETRQAIAQFREVPIKDRRAFAAWVLMRGKDSKVSRKHQREADLQNRVEGAVFKKLEGFEEYLGGVDVKKGTSWDGDPCLYIIIHVRKDVDIDAFSEKKCGLGVDIHDALGEEYEDLFPYLELKSFEAKGAA